MDSFITYGVTALLIILIVVPYYLRTKRKEKKAREKFQRMQISGLHEASAMHPHIDLTACIGCGACVKACPEGEVLGLIDGKATLIHGAKCVGHGLCAEACPVGGIELLMAAPGRSANVPLLSPVFETTVPGIFIVGELGGLGLIKNAITQGKAVVAHIASLPRSTRDDVLDIAIVGAGPSGMAAGLTALEQKLRYVVLEQSDIGGAILQYPKAKVVMTAPVELPLWGKIKLVEVKKEALLELWESVIAKTGLNILTQKKVTAISREEDWFVLTTGNGTLKSRYVVLALGRRGTPRKLGVPGEQLPKVMYRLMDAATYQHVRALVVGGGDSAIEAAVGLATQKGVEVTLSYRKGEFTRIKERNMQHLKEQQGRKKLQVVFHSDVKEITETEAVLTTPEGERRLANDYVFIFAGGEMPFEFLKSVGVQMQTAAM